MAKFTKKAIKETFLELLKIKSLDKITVKDIIQACEVNRNTFYYYYKDIYLLLEDIFQEEAKRILMEAKENATFYEEYARAASIVLNHKQAVMNIYNSKSREVLRDYLEKVTQGLVERFVIKAAEEYNISVDGIKYITNFYSYALVENSILWIRDGMPPYREKVLKKISESFEATVEYMIKDWIERGIK